MKLCVLILTLTAPLTMAIDPTDPDGGGGNIDRTLLHPRDKKLFPNPADLPAKTALPDPLLTLLGHAVKTREDWEKERAPELRRLFEYYMYGQMPAKPETFAAKVVHENKEALGGKATLKDIDIRMTKPDLDVHLLVLIPNKRTGRVPAFLGINFNGNHTLLADPSIRLPESWMPQRGAGGAASHKASDAERGSEIETWAVEQTIDRGYAFASFYNGDVVPDQADLAKKRLAEFPRAEGVTDDDAAATIACWAWGFSRMIDYLLTEPAIDSKKIAVVGHSRNGKTALLAAAMDPRIALAIPTQAGCGGTAPNRLPPELQNPPDGKLIHETVKRINASFPHWFCGNFKAFNDVPEKLPFDQHCLIALCAPRPVLLSNATEDLWANPAGQFEMARAADPVYRLVCNDGLGAQVIPKVGELLPSRLGYYIRAGKHSMTTDDWKVWLDYADKWLKKEASAAQ